MAANMRRLPGNIAKPPAWSPKSARAFYGLGIAEAAAGNFAAARKALETAYSSCRTT